MSDYTDIGLNAQLVTTNSLMNRNNSGTYITSMGFDSSYEGGDFCAGLTFGYSGSNLLFKIAEEIITRNIAPTPKNSNNTISSIENTH